jgi:hypothetical protein
VLQECYKSVARVLQECCNSVYFGDSRRLLMSQNSDMKSGERARGSAQHSARPTTAKNICVMGQYGYGFGDEAVNGILKLQGNEALLVRASIKRALAGRTVGHGSYDVQHFRCCLPRGHRPSGLTRGRD